MTTISPRWKTYWKCTSGLACGAGTGSTARQQIRTSRNCQCFLRRRIEGRPPFHLRHTGSFRFRVRSGCRHSGEGISASENNPLGNNLNIHRRKALVDVFGAEMAASRRISDLKTLRQQAKDWNRRMNGDLVKIAWKFDRKTARRKFGYQTKSFTRPRS